MMLQVVVASGAALDSNTIATYLTQMWIGNIMQTFGWSIAGYLAAANSGRWGSRRREGAVTDPLPQVLL